MPADPLLDARVALLEAAMKSTANTQLDLQAEESTDWQQLRTTYQASLASNGLDYFLKTPEKAKPEEAPVHKDHSRCVWIPCVVSAVDPEATPL